VTEPKESEGLDTDAIDDGWGAEPELEPVPRPKKPKALAPQEPPSAAEQPPDDEIEFDADVARDSMPTIQHPNPLEFDRDPDAEAKRVPRVPKPPPLPKLRGTKR
jgi:hypothetical protein